MKRVILALACVLTFTGFSACTSNPQTTTTQTPQQTIFEAKSGYAVALTAAVAYKRLPNCKAAKPPCSDSAIVAQLQKADTVAASALDAAEAAARTPGFGDSVVASSATAAQAALRAFVSITSTLQVK